jgi:cation diffusion facilitator family transporter
MAAPEDVTPPSLTSVPLVGVAVNAALAALKVITGVFGNSYALIADGIESTSDIVTSLVVWGGLRVAATPANERHPYGYGKAEALAGVIAALALLAAAVMIAVQSVREILTPHRTALVRTGCFGPGGHTKEAARWVGQIRRR